MILLTLDEATPQMSKIIKRMSSIESLYESYESSKRRNDAAVDVVLCAEDIFYVSQPFITNIASSCWSGMCFALELIWFKPGHIS